MTQSTPPRNASALVERLLEFVERIRSLIDRETAAWRARRRPLLLAPGRRIPAREATLFRLALWRDSTIDLTPAQEARARQIDDDALRHHTAAL